MHQVQEAKLFNDDKYFVDMKLKETPGKLKGSKSFYLYSWVQCVNPLFLFPPLFFPADVVLSAFHNLSQEHPNTTLPPGKLQEFLTTYFEAPGTEFESWTPPDWHDKWDPVINGLVSSLWSFYCAWLTRVDFFFSTRPKFLEGIADQELHNWAEKIHHLWKSLGRKVMILK